MSHMFIGGNAQNNILMSVQSEGHKGTINDYVQVEGG